MKNLHLLAVFALLTALGVGAAAQEAPAPPPPEPVDLPTPFTAERIRDEWVPGLTLEMLQKTPEGDQRQRWTVKSADREGASIEFAVLAADGTVVGEPRVAYSTWDELRDHAAFDSQIARRERATVATTLGELDGWLYFVRDDDTGVVTEFFFADAFPGAPVEMRVTKGGTAVIEMLQVARSKP